MISKNKKTLLFFQSVEEDEDEEEFESIEPSITQKPLPNIPIVKV
jgi:hypothetical protein